MSWQVSSEVEQATAAVGPLLAADPVSHNIALGVLAAGRSQPDGTVYAWWTDAGGQVAGAASCTPAFPWLLSVVPEPARRSLVDLLVHHGAAGLNGRTDVVVEIGALLARRTGRVARILRAERLHRLSALIPPSPAPPGSARVAGPDDESVLVEWVKAFQVEAGAFPQDVAPLVRSRLRQGGFVVWEDGGPVSMAGRVDSVAGLVRIGPVYTPPAHRGHGYAAGATAHASALSLADNASVVLHTDLTNSTSNALYARLGFVPVHDRAVISLVDPAG